MADLNKVFLIGRLTQDPELRYTSNGSPVTDLRLATSRPFGGGGGGGGGGGQGEEGGERERREETLYIDITVWNRQAETCCQYLTKGSAVHVEGFLRMDTWDDKTTGEKRSKIKVVAERVQFLDGGRRQGGEGPGRSEAPMPRSAEGGEPRGYNNGAGRPAAPAAPRRAPAPQQPPADDDIPF